MFLAFFVLSYLVKQRYLKLKFAALLQHSVLSCLRKKNWYRIPIASECAMKRLDDTGHSPRLFAEFDAAGLVAPIQEKWVSIEKGLNHPVLPFRNAVQCLSERGKLPALLGDCFFSALDSLKDFWDMYSGHQPNHPVYSLEPSRLKNTVPLMVHADEGTGKKKEGHHEFANPTGPWQRDVAKSKGWTELCRSKHCYPLSLQCDDGKGLLWEAWRTIGLFGWGCGPGFGRSFSLKIEAIGISYGVACLVLQHLKRHWLGGTCQPWRKRRFLWMLHRRLLKFAWSCLSHQFTGSGWTSLRGHLHQTCPSPYPLAQAATSAQALLYPYYNQPFLSGLEPFWFQGPRDSVNLQNFNMTYLYIPNSFMIWNMQHVFENKKNLSFMAKILGKLSTSFGSIMFFFTLTCCTWMVTER